MEEKKQDERLKGNEEALTDESLDAVAAGILQPPHSGKYEIDDPQRAYGGD